MSKQSTGEFEYLVKAATGDPTSLLNEHAQAGWVLHSVVKGWFDRCDVWNGIGWTIFFCRPRVSDNDEATTPKKVQVERV